MSNSSLTKEFLIASEIWGITLEDIEKLNLNAMKSAFIPYNERIKYIYDIIKPGFRKMRERLLSLKS
jgi:adenosine deaminase